MRMHLSSHWKAFAVWLEQNKLCGLGAGDMQNSENLLKKNQKNTYSIIFTIRGNGVMLVSQNDIFHSEPCMEMSSEKTRESISPHPQFMNSCIWAGQKKMPAWHFIHQWWKSNRDPAGWFRTGEGFRDKAAIKNEWLFATNTVAPESFMGHVMEKYEGTNDRGNPLPRQTSMKQQDLGDRYHWIWAMPLTNMFISLVCCMYSILVGWINGREDYQPFI